MIDKPMQAMQMLMITSVTHHQQRFSIRNTKVNGRKNAALITQGMIGAAWRFPGKTLKQGWQCGESWLVNACCSY
jgi:hypothetical protein